MKHEKFLKLSQLALMSSLAISTTILSPNANAHGSSHPHWDRWDTQSNYTEYLDFSGKEDNTNYSKKVAFYVLKVENQKVVEPSIIQFFNHNHEPVKATLEFANNTSNTSDVGKINVDLAGHLTLDSKEPVANGTYVFILKQADDLNQAAKDNLGQNISYSWNQEKIKGVSGHNDGLVLKDVKLMSFDTLSEEVKDLKVEQIKEDKSFNDAIHKVATAIEKVALIVAGFVAIKMAINKTNSNQLNKTGQFSEKRQKYLASLDEKETVKNSDTKNMKM